MPDPGGAAARRRRGRRPSAGQIDSALAAATTGLALYKTGREWWDRLTKPPVYTITVTSDDRLYGDVLADLLRRIPDPDRRSLAAAYQGGSRANDPALALVYSGSITHTIRLDGHPVQVSTALLGRRPGSGGSDAAVADSTDGSDPWWDVLPKKLVITCADIAGRDAATRWLTDLAETRRRRGTRPQMHLLAAWGGWHAVGDVHGRSTDSVALAPGQMDRLVADLGLFLTSRARYDESGIPYHRGYLFEGPPGGGKSSVARALAAHFNLDLWYMPLSDIPGDTDLLRQIAEIRGGILLLEDVDVFSAIKDRDHDGPDQAAGAVGRRVTLSGMLNALDGVATPPGLVTVMSTNKPDQLDPALVRQGRVGLREYFGPVVTTDQAQALVANVYPDRGQRPLSPRLAAALVGRMPAAIVGACAEHMDDFDQAHAALQALVEAPLPAAVDGDRGPTTGVTSHG